MTKTNQPEREIGSENTNAPDPIGEDTFAEILDEVTVRSDGTVVTDNEEYWRDMWG